MATQFDDCLRRCEPCAIGASNAANSDAVTYIHRDPLKNIPSESREGAIQALAQAFNVRNRESKRRRFGFSTSEDAVTWVVFTYLLRSGQLLGALHRAGIIADATIATAPTLLLWGVPIDNGTRGTQIRNQLSELCTSLQEDPNSFSEPDVSNRSISVRHPSRSFSFVSKSAPTGSECRNIMPSHSKMCYGEPHVFARSS